VLAMKQANVDFAICSCVQSTVLAMVTGLKQAGSTAKSLSQASADSSLFSSASATQAAQGMYYASTFPPLDTNNPASNTFVANIKAVDPTYQAGQYPSFGVVAGYLGSALMAEGIQVAGQNPTRESFIQNLTKVTAWDANGLLPAPVGFNHFGTAQKTYCEFYVRAQGQGFVAVNGGKAFCLDVPPNL
jgi:branched-chain amino acid transport system substrate-binding protein